MSTDPKKNDEIRDEDLESVAGGTDHDDSNDPQPDPGGPPADDPVHYKAGREKS